MMNSQSCYQNPINNFQLCLPQNGPGQYFFDRFSLFYWILPSETPKIESTKNLYVKRSEFLKVTGHEVSSSYFYGRQNHFGSKLIEFRTMIGKLL